MAKDAGPIPAHQPSGGLPADTLPHRSDEEMEKIRTLLMVMGERLMRVEQYLQLPSSTTDATTKVSSSSYPTFTKKTPTPM
ncbi:hypothetical protein ACI68E_000204 [Malassezia pachydermatis]